MAAQKQLPELHYIYPTVVHSVVCLPVVAQLSLWRACALSKYLKNIPLQGLKLYQTVQTFMPHT